MVVDGEAISTSVPQMRTFLGTVFIGGTSEPLVCDIPVQEPFRGCMEDIALNGR